MKVFCQKCGKEKTANLSKVNLKTYMKQYPLCRQCGFNKDNSKNWFKKGYTPWNKGIEGSYLPHWKGDKVGYDALHDWVERKLGKPRLCDFCKTKESSSFEWSNKSGQYKRVLSDWQRLCKKCHLRYDYENFGIRKEIFT